MIDLQKSFRQGLDAYRDAERARAEIDQVVREFSAQIKAASEGAILEIKVVERTRTNWAGNPLKLSFPEHIEFHALVAFGKPSAEQPNPEQFLCTFQMGTNGYPVTLTYADVEARCHDRSSLESQLANLLQHPDTGEKLAKLIRSTEAA